MLNLETSAFAVQWVHLSISRFTVFGVSCLSSSVPFAGISSVFFPSGYSSDVRTLLLFRMPCGGPFPLAGKDVILDGLVFVYCV
jgi:hypothetical protein